MLDRCYFGWQHMSIASKNKDFQKKARISWEDNKAKSQSSTSECCKIHILKKQKNLKEQITTCLDASDNQKHIKKNKKNKTGLFQLVSAYT